MSTKITVLDVADILMPYIQLARNPHVVRDIEDATDHLKSAASHLRSVANLIAKNRPIITTATELFVSPSETLENKSPRKIGTDFLSGDKGTPDEMIWLLQRRAFEYEKLAEGFLIAFHAPSSKASKMPLSATVHRQMISDLIERWEGLADETATNSAPFLEGQPTDYLTQFLWDCLKVINPSATPQMAATAIRNFLEARQAAAEEEAAAFEEDL